MGFSINNLKNRKIIKKESYINFSDSRLFLEASADYLIKTNQDISCKLSKMEFNNEYCDIDKSKTILNDIIASFIKGIEETYINFYKQIIEIYSKNKDIYSSINIDTLSDESVFRYEKERFIYSNLRTLDSYSSFKTDIIKYPNRLIVDIKNLTDKNIDIVVKDSIISRIRSQKLSTITELNNFRSELLNKYGEVTEEEFATSLYNYFRPTFIQANSVINKSELIQIKNDYNSLSTIVKIIENDKSRFLSSTDEVIKIFDSLSEYNNIPNDMVIDTIKNLSIILNTYQLLFSARLDAIKDNIKTDIDILDNLIMFMEVK